MVTFVKPNIGMILSVVAILINDTHTMHTHARRHTRAHTKRKRKRGQETERTKECGRERARESSEKKKRDSNPCRSSASWEFKKKKKSSRYL